jgi:hypothetical protein
MPPSDETSTGVKATLHYLARTERKPYLYMFEPP